MSHGSVEDWDAMSRVLSHAYDGTNLSVAPEDAPLLITEAPLTSARHRERLAELAFETLHVPALHVAATPTLALYGAGRTTGLVVEVGDGVTSATPIYEGFAITHAAVRSDVGGRDVTASLQAQLRRGGHVFHTSAEGEMLRCLKETACYVARNPVAEEASLRKEAAAVLHSGSASARGGGVGAAAAAAASAPGVALASAVGGAGGSSTSSASASSAGAAGAAAVAGKGGAPVPLAPGEYLLPDGQRLRLGGERFRAAEVLFQPALAGLELPGVHEAAAMAVSKADLELRPALLGGVLLAGGATATPGFGERLLVELKRSLPADAKVRITAPKERKVLPWVGGSILASLGTFRGMCVRREAWEESGAAALARMPAV